jgi:hypothetical protein
MEGSRLSGKAYIRIISVLITSIGFSCPGAIQSGQVLVKDVHGGVTYSVGADWLSLQANVTVGRGATIKTSAGATADLILQYNGTVLRLLPNSTLSFDKLDKQAAGEAVITETSLNLTAGSIIGSQRKLSPPSHFDISVGGVVATIKGTEYIVRADGAVTCISGSIKVIFNLPNNGGSVNVNVPAGFTFNPATGQVVPTSGFVDTSKIIADINTVRENAQVFKAGGATVVVKPEEVLSPTKGSKGNNGVGNGQDPQPPGNPPINDGPGTGPGNPGNRQHGSGSLDAPRTGNKQIN